MKCPKCRFANPEGLKFCNQCGNKLEVICPKCRNKNAPASKFCGECGSAIEPDAKLPPGTSKRDTLPSAQPKEKSLEGERKHVTALFSDLSGYTAMSEKLDPETVKDIMGRIFTEASKIADKFDATVEKFFGDEIMIILGVPKAHEDDPIRAINVALEIHERVAKISSDFKKETGFGLQMHTGINSGLVVTGDKFIGKSRHGLTGDTINLAKRLTGLAEPGEIVVGSDTYQQSSGYFNFEDLKTAEVKGKAEQVQVYRVVSQKDRPRKIHRLQGVRAKLIGRKVEMTQLQEAANRLRKGRSTVFSIVGTAGTGKSRLIEEFKESLDPKEIQWREGHAYPYTQSVPYFPLINLLSNAFGIKEGDSPEKMKVKIESGVTYLMGEDEVATPYIGSLFSLPYSEIDRVSPEFWKSKLQQSILAILSALAKMGPTVICLEDLHWADPSFIDLIRYILSDIRAPVLFLCIYRPIITLFSSHQITSMSGSFKEIRIQDLSASESQDMLESLLNTNNIPDELRQFVQEKVQGNPFYLEEVINSFIELKTLIRENGNWCISRPITEADISASIHSVISARLDRLDLETKRILQQAAVIGRAFYYEILKKISDLKVNIDGCLSGLERLDLIKTRSIEPDLEYIFKHAITQEVVYNGLLRKERQIVHGQIGSVIEQLFKGRLPEFYETLAFHFSRSQSPIKAVDYLLKAGEKSLAKYSVKEAHLYFQKAYDILAPKKDKSNTEKILLVDILNNWGYAYYYLGDAKNFIDRFSSCQELAESINDNSKLGMFYVWFGIALWLAGKTKDAYERLKKALILGEESGDKKVEGYASTWLTWSCAELGSYAEGIEFGERAQEISKSFPSDQYLFFKSLAGICYISYFQGNPKRLFQGTAALLDYGSRYSNNRSMVFGHWLNSCGYYLIGDLDSSKKSSKKGIEVAMDPFYSQFPKILLGGAYLLNKQVQEAKDVLQPAMAFFKKYDMGQCAEITNLWLSLVSMAEGEMKRGFKQLEKSRQILFRNQRRSWYILSEYFLGRVYSSPGPKPSFTIMAKNIGFLVKNVPFAGKKAEEHYYNAIQIAEEIGARGFLGRIYLDIGLFYKAKKKTELARKSILKAIDFFKESEADVYLKQAHEELEPLC